MDLSSIIINRIKKSDIHCDLKSLEVETNIKKKKYKLYLNRFLDNFIFFKFTREKSSCDRSCTLVVMKKDLKNRKPEHLRENVSYVDASKPEILSEDEIVGKINDTENKFELVASLQKKKFKTLVYLLKKSKHRTWKYSPTRIDLINIALDSLAEEKVKKLGLQ